MNKKYLIILVIAVISIVSIAVRYWPVYYKGYSYDISAINLILARNLHLTGEYKLDSEKNIVLSSEIVREKGIESQAGNKLTPILYSKIFDIFGFNQSIPLWASLILYGISSVLLFLLIFKLFNVWIALLFSFVEIFSPLVIQHPIVPGQYEWAILFLTIALLLYLWKEKPSSFKLLLIGFFLALASLARNSFLIIPIAFLIYDFIKIRSFKRIIIFILPVLILWGIFWGPNVYISTQETSSAYLHIFPDPYTWHFERDAYAEKAMESAEYNYDYSQFLSKYGYPVSLRNKILMYWASIISYPKGLVAQTTFGGPILIFFLILGAFYLFKKNRPLLILFVLWSGLTYLFLVAMASNHWGHFLSLQFPIFLLISLGIYWSIQLILRQNFKAIFKYILIFGFILVLFLHLIQSDKWTFHERYLYSRMGDTLELVEIIKKEKDKINKKEDVIAVGSPNSQAPGILNWYTDFNYVYFDPMTIQKLLKENKLQWAFDHFGVTRIIGYDRDLTKEILKVIEVKEI